MGGLPHALQIIRISAQLTIAQLRRDPLSDRRPGVKYALTGRQWLEVLTHKYTSAFIWGLMVWVLIWLMWLGVSWAGLATRLDTGLRQVMWAVGLLSVVFVSNVGARQAIRQKMLFMRIGRSPTFSRDWLLFFAMAFAPLGLVWLMSTVWSWLAATVTGFYLTLGLLFVLAVVVARERIGQ